MGRGRPLAGLLVVAAVVATAALTGSHHASPGRNTDGGALRIERAVLRSGAIALLVTNGTGRPARLAQVAIDRGFVPFSGANRSLAPHSSAQLRIPYPWVPGEGYDVKVLTGSGATLTYRIASAS